MAVDILSLGFKVDTAPVKNASKDLDKLGTSAKGAGSSLNKMGSDAVSTGRNTDVLTGSVKGLVGAYAGLAGLKAFAGIVDEQKKYTAQLKLATNTQDEFNAALSKVKDIATKAQSDIGSIATVYARLTNALKDVGTSQKTVGIITENVALALKVGGASASEASAAMLQLSQAFASGVLRGDEFNSMAESAPNLMRALAESMGVTVGQLRQMAAEGKITGEELNKAFGDEKLNEKLQAQAKEVTTLSGAWTVLMNEIKSTVGMIGEQSGVVDIMTGAINGLAKAMKLLRDNIPTKDEGARILTLIPGAVPGYGIFSDVTKGAALLSRNRRIATGGSAELSNTAKNPNSIGGSGAITYGGSVSPNFGSTVEVQDIRDVHRLQDEQERKSKELSDKAKQARDKAVQEEEAREKAYLKMKQNFAAMDEKYNDIATEVENKALKRRKEYEKEAYENKIKYLDLAYARSQKENEEAQRDFIKAEEEKLRQFEKTVDGINQVFREGFANLVNSGMGSWKAFTKQLYTTFKTAVADKIYKLFAEPFIFNVIASIAGVSVAGSANASSITGSSGGSIFSTITDSIKSLNNNIVGSLESFGSFLTDGFGQLGSDIGGYIGANASAIADGFSYAGALFQAAQGNFAGAIGTAIGTYFGGPVGGAIGSMVGNLVGGLFGGSHVSRPKYYANTKVTNSGTSLINAYGNSDASGTGGDVAINSGKGLGDAILAYTKAFGGTSKDFTIGTNYQSKYNTYLATIGGNTAKNGIGSDFQFKPEQAMNATAFAFVTAVKKGLVSIPDYLSKVISRSDVNLANSLDSINALGAVVTMKKSLSDLPPVFMAIANVINKSLTLDKVDELQARFNAINTYTSLFYTDAEKFGYFSKQITTQFTALNQSVPQSRDAFRSLVDGVDTTTDSGMSLFNSLIDLAPTMDAYYKALQQQDEATRSLAESMGLLDINNFKTLVDYTRAQRYVDNGISLTNPSSYANPTIATPNLTMSTDNTALLAAMENLRTENQAQQVAISQSTQKTAKLLDKFDSQGIQLSETNNSGTRIVLNTRVVA